jgi:hypothetical protein
LCIFAESDANKPSGHFWRKNYEIFSFLLVSPVFENRVLRRIFGPKRDEVTGDWRKLHNEELHSLYSSPNRMIKSRRMRWEGM